MNLLSSVAIRSIRQQIGVLRSTYVSAPSVFRHKCVARRFGVDSLQDPPLPGSCATPSTIDLISPDPSSFPPPSIVSVGSNGKTTILEFEVHGQNGGSAGSLVEHFQRVIDKQAKLDVPALVRQSRYRARGTNYTFQLYTLLKSLLPPGFSIIPSATIHPSSTSSSTSSSPRPFRVDLVIINAKGEKTVVEVVAHEQDGGSDGSVHERILRSMEEVERIAGVKGVKACVINFTTRKPEEGYMWLQDVVKDRGEEQQGRGGGGVRVIHVYHDLGWTEVLISEAPDKVTYIKL